MICEKCGKQNPLEETICINCGVGIPRKTKCGGFGDILSYEGKDATMPVIEKDREDGKIVKLLLRKTDNVMKQTDKNLFISKIAVCVSVIVLGCSIVFGIMTVNSINKAKNELQNTINSLRNELREAEKK